MSMAAQAHPRELGELERLQQRPPAPLAGLFSQFAWPTGLLGRLAGALMARGVADDRWVIDLLDIQPDDRVLEIGSGPGVAIELLAARAGFVAGVDPSPVMVQQAAQRNRVALAQGRVELRLGSVASLPYPASSFTKACAIHSVYFWPSLVDGLREVQRVLVPSGRLVVLVRLQRPDAGPLDPARQGLTEAHLERIIAALHATGFSNVAVQRRQIGRQRLAAILATRSASQDARPDPR